MHTTPLVTVELVNPKSWCDWVSRCVNKFRATLLLNFCFHVLPGYPPAPHSPSLSSVCPIRCVPKCSMAVMPAGAHGAHFLMRPWSILAMPRCQRFPWALFGARPPERTGQQKSKGTQHGFFLHRRDHRNFMILKIHHKIECFCKFLDIKNGPFWSPLAPKGAPCWY